LDKYKIQKPAKNHRQINPQRITDTIFIYIIYTTIEFGPRLTLGEVHFHGQTLLTVRTVHAEIRDKTKKEVLD